MVESRTTITNLALDFLGKDPIPVDLDTATTPLAKRMQRHYDANFRRCLRKALWPFALKRTTLNPSSTAPVNEFSFAYPIPSDCVKIVQLWPSNADYRREGRKILTDESSVTIRYVSDESVLDPSYCDADFIEWVALSLAVRASYGLTDSVDLRKDLTARAEEAFKEATATFSMEDTEEAIGDSIFITDREYASDTDEIRLYGLET